MHDVGKTKVDIKIIMKPGSLTEAEFAEMKKHPQYAADILGKQNVSSKIQKIALEHHEHMDGKGYPKGLSSGKISKHSRLMGIVDVYDAMTTDRCYNRAVDSAEAIKVMSKNPNQFDPEMFGEFKKLINSETIGK